LDLTDTTYLDASALGFVVYLRNQVRKRGLGTVQLVGVRPHLLRTFRVTGLDKLFIINELPEGERADIGLHPDPKIA